MSFLYPFTISVSRAQQSFSSANGAAQTLESIATGLMASIQVARNSRAGAPLGFEGSTNSNAPMPSYLIFVPGVANSLIQAGDMITDTTPNGSGTVYKVDWPEWSLLGNRLFCSIYEPQS